MISAGDVIAGAITKWNADAMNTSVGPLLSGRASAPTPPYAVATAENTRNQYYTEGVSGAVYVSHWRLTITIYGVGSAAVDALVKTAGADFDVQTLTVAGATLLDSYPADGWPKLTEDPSRKQGEDYWQGILAVDVALSGTL